MINNGNNHVLHHVILYIEDVDLNIDLTDGTRLEIKVILYIEDVDLNTVYVSPLIGVPGHPLH